MSATKTASRATRVATTGGRAILPVMAPEFNMREIAKQMAMLEDHLNHPSKRCRDCINKHFLTIEGLAEECATLCPGSGREDVRALAGRVASSARVLHHAWAAAPGKASVIAAKVRVLRKELMRRYSVLPLHKLPDRERLAVRALTSGRATATATATATRRRATASKTATRRRSTASTAARRVARAR